MSSSRVGVAAILAAFLLASTASFAGAQELIIPKPKVRLFPQGVFCPLPLDFEFVANGSIATIRFSTNVFFFDDIDSQIEWSEQSIDNIVIAKKSDYLAHLGTPGSYSSDCYIGETIAQRFYFQDVATLPFKDLFDTDPAANGWDLTAGAYWNLSEGAPDNPGTESPPANTRSLGLGQDSATPALTDSAVTSVVVNGLTSGETYVLTGWWNVGNMEPSELTMVVRIYGDQTTPIAKKSWGYIKSRYK